MLQNNHPAVNNLEPAAAPEASLIKKVAPALAGGLFSDPGRCRDRVVHYLEQFFFSIRVERNLQF
ncbi:hypothetical protein [Methanosphaerula palustris]|uniref:hypothetical protein n=1 Tax=Methanosphaerula palustris TaxID=475088 RepID=UPI000324659C|nr:hypothetical protein [Methanosphaerula palustris]